jgi:osmotically-inducible protein OsmY
MALTLSSRRDHDRQGDGALSDRTLKGLVVRRLRENPDTESGHIAVNVRDGVVQLEGDVPTPIARDLAAEDVGSMPGVHDVENDLAVGV